jgi:hypothetical protein
MVASSSKVARDLSSAPLAACPPVAQGGADMTCMRVSGYGGTPFLNGGSCCIGQADVEYPGSSIGICRPVGNLAQRGQLMKTRLPTTRRLGISAACIF